MNQLRRASKIDGEATSLRCHESSAPVGTTQLSSIVIPLAQLSYVLELKDMQEILSGQELLQLSVPG